MKKREMCPPETAGMSIRKKRHTNIVGEEEFPLLFKVLRACLRIKLMRQTTGEIKQSLIKYVQGSHERRFQRRQGQ